MEALAIQGVANNLEEDRNPAKSQADAVVEKAAVTFRIGLVVAASTSA